MRHYLSRLEETVRKQWDSKALSNFRGESFTFGELATYIEKFHIFFEAAGVGKGDKIAICAKNTARWAVSFFAINTYEAVAVPILSEFHPDNVNWLVDHSESKLLITDNDIWEKLDIKKMPRLTGVFSANDFSLLFCRFSRPDILWDSHGKTSATLPETTVT